MKLKRLWQGVACALGVALAPAAMAAVTVQLLDSSQRISTLRITVDGPKLEVVETPEGRFERFSQRESSRGGTNADSPGEAELPLVGFPLALPVDLREASVTVTPEGEPLRMQARLYPVQPPDAAQAGNREPPRFQFDRDTYFKIARSAGQSLGSKSIFKGDANVESFRFSPYGYEPGPGVLTWHRSYLVQVLHAAGNCFVIDHLLEPKTRPAFDGIDEVFQRQPLPALGYALNARFVGQRFCPPVQPAPNLFGARFLIVSHPNFLVAANVLKAHKQALGISTAVINTGGLFINTAPGIRAAIANYYNSHVIKPRWVLFMGDSEYVPTHYDLPDGDSRTAGDIWYGQFQPGATAETIPPFGIGRFPVDTLAQANAMVNKVIAFENNPPANPVFGQDFYSRLTFASYFQPSVDPTRDERWFVETSEMARNHLLGLGYNVRRIYTTDAGANPQRYNSGAPIPADLRKPGFAWNGNATDIVNAVNQGTALLYHRDHGAWWGWGDPFFNTASLAGISVVNNQFPVVFSINCASGIFDNETVDLPGNIFGPGYMVGAEHTATWWAEAFVRKADGALAVIGDSRNSSTIDNNHLTLGLFDAVFPGFNPGFGTAAPVRRLGDVLNKAKAFIAAVDAGATLNQHPLAAGGSRPGVQGLRKELNIYNLLGDPTVALRVSPPWQFGNLGVIRAEKLLRIRVPINPGCLSCPKELLVLPELITAVAFEPKSGRIVGRGVISNEGDGSIDLGDYRGEVVVRVTSSDGNSQQAAEVETDSDGDGVPDSRDNCASVRNANQRDSDNDGFGDACDADINNDGIVNSLDLGQLRAAFGSRVRSRADLNGDGVVNALDLGLLRRLFGTRPGPSAWHLPAAD